MDYLVTMQKYLTYDDVSKIFKYIKSKQWWDTIDGLDRIVGNIAFKPVERYFKENGFNTLVINSLTTKNNYDTIRKTKTDKKDCYRLAKLFFVNEVEYHDLSKKDLYANLKAMTRQYFYLLQNNVSCKNRYKRLINICFPELEKIFKSTRIYDDTALNFIKEFPHAEIVKEKRIDALYNNLYKTNGRNLNFYKKLSTTIKTASINSN